jgi:hypothetical protein
MRQFGFTSILGRDHSKISNVNIQYKSKIENGGLQSFSHLIPQLKEDKLFYDDDDYTIVLDGVVLNRLSLMKQESSWSQSVIGLYQKRGDLFLWIGEVLLAVSSMTRNGVATSFFQTRQAAN